MTMGNAPITAGFVVIAAAQLALGIYLVILGVKEKSKAKLHTQNNHVSESPCASPWLHVYRSSISTDTS